MGPRSNDAALSRSRMSLISRLTIEMDLVPSLEVA